MRRRGLWACVLALSTVTLHADDVFLKSGGKVSGRVLARTDTSVEVDVGAGRVTLPMTSVLRIEERRSSLDEYHERATRLRPGDVPGWTDLAKWAAAANLSTQARQAWQRVLEAAPNHPQANAALGRVQVEGGRWLPEDEANRARGLVRVDGRWMTPAEQAALVERREADAAQRQARIEAQLRVREAEARAREAEARARQAEAQAATTVTPPVAGVPVWWGWGGVIGTPERPTSSYGPRGPMSGPYWQQPLPGMIGPVGGSLPSLSPFAPPEASQRPVALPTPGARPHSDLVHGQRTRTRD